MIDPDASEPMRTYSFLGPRGTFTEAALAQIDEARGQEWRPVNNVGEALADVVSRRSDAAMIAIENSVEGGVSVAQDALSTIPGLRIVRETLVPVRFDLVARPGTTLADVRTIGAHPVAYAQCRRGLERDLPDHVHLPAASNVQAAIDLRERDQPDAALAPAGSAATHGLAVLAADIGDNANAVTRFVLVTRAEGEIQPATGSDKTSVVAELPVDEPGALLDLLEQFSTRGVNLSLIESRPIGDALGRYRFVIDADGHVRDERVADALLGVRRFSPGVTFLGSYPRAEAPSPAAAPAPDAGRRYEDAAFVEARDWLRELVSGAPVDGDAAGTA